MGWVRGAFVAILAAAVGYPVGVVVWQNLSWRALDDARREPVSVGAPLANTAALMALTVLLAVPPGVAFAFLSNRPGLRGRHLLEAGALACLFVPLPVWAVSWQIVLGEWLPPVALEPGEVAWRPWTLGLLPAAWIHAVAAAPWVAVIVRLALRGTDPALVDEARQTGGPRGVFRWAIRPQLARAVAGAAAVVAVQAGTEIAVTDAMMVRTFAEEVYTQMIVRSSGLSAAMVATVPVWLGGAAVLGLLAGPILRRPGPAAQTLLTSPGVRHRFRFRATAGAWVPFSVCLGLPVGALVWKAAGGGLGHPSLSEFAQRIEKVIRTESHTLLDSLAGAALAGVATAALAWIGCALGWASRRHRAALLWFNLLLLAWPGPLLGFAIKQAIVAVVGAEEAVLGAWGLRPEFPPLRSSLYDQPSPIPGVWVCTIRFFPLACAMMAVAMGRLPKPALEAAAGEGRSAFAPWRWVIAPLTARAFLLVTLASAALAFGEVSAGKIAQPPARGVSILRLFDQMHYGAEGAVAALALLQLATTWGILLLLLGVKRERTP